MLREKLANLERFLRGSDDIDPIIRMAAAHYQLHPFTDGNDRTAPILNTPFLIDKKPLDLPIPLLEPLHQRTSQRILRLNAASGAEGHCPSRDVGA